MLTENPGRDGLALCCGPRIAARSNLLSFGRRCGVRFCLTDDPPVIAGAAMKEIELQIVGTANDLLFGFRREAAWAAE